MMIKKRNKLSIVTAFIVGTTMLSPMDKAWGMDDENDLKPTSSSRAVASRFFLTGTTRVSEDVRKAAKNLSDVLEKNPKISKLNARGKKLRNGLVKKDSPSWKNISTLAQGGILRVMADLDSEKPGLPLDTLFSESLKAIQSAVEDPCDVITSGESKLVVGVDTIKSLRDDIIRAKGDGKLSDFFSDELPNLVRSYPTIVNSLIARFPREEEKIEQQRRKLEIYFYGDSQKKAQRELSNHQKKIQEQRRIAKIDTLAEAFYLLKQINDKQAPLASSAPIELDPLSLSSSSSSSMPSVRTTFRTTGINPNAINKHSAISIQLPNQQLQDDMYTLVINHRTSVKGSQVRTYAPKHGKLNILGDLPLSATFSDTSFNITPWVQSIREEGSLMTNIAAYLTFVDGQSDIHSFTIQPKESSLMTVILGDKDSEAQSGIHVYAPETDGDTNDWSESQIADE